MLNDHLIAALVNRPCSVCGTGSDQSLLVLEQNINLADLDGFGFASRKPPDNQHHQLLQCKLCDVWYASPVLNEATIHKLYKEASFDTGDEAAFAARTYGKLLAHRIDLVPDTLSAIDVGTGDGAFLLELKKLGFQAVFGIEPSDAPIKMAHPSIRQNIINKPFQESDFTPGEFSLISCFQTIEHLSDPGSFVKSARNLLKENGVLMIVCHNRRGILNRLLGRKSPIIDVEHLQLFSPKSIEYLLSTCGFKSVEVSSFVNSYPLRYWLRLLPLPKPFSRFLQSLLVTLRLDKLVVSLPVGNLAVFGSR